MINPTMKFNMNLFLISVPSTKRDVYYKIEKKFRNIIFNVVRSVHVLYKKFLQLVQLFEVHPSNVRVPQYISNSQFIYILIDKKNQLREE